jgi:hypothetical protein
VPLKPRRPIRKRDDVLTGPLSDDARWFLNAGFCLDGCPCGLEQDLDRARRLWERHRAEILEGFSRPGCAGRRPWALYHFEHGLQYIPRPEVDFLRERGLLEPWETVALGKVGGSSTEE